MTVQSGKVHSGKLLLLNTQKNGIQTYEGVITRATKSYIVVADKFIYVDKIISITGGGEETSEDSTGDDSTVSDTGPVQETKPKIEAKEGDLPRGVFVLPLSEMVGTYFRDTEITRLVEHVEENYGLGQIIILEIDSGGGAVHIWDKIRQVVFEARD